MNNDGEKLGKLIGQMEMVINRLQIIHDDITEIKDDAKENVKKVDFFQMRSDMKAHADKDEGYYQRIHSLEKNQAKVTGVAAGIALVVGVGVEKVKNMLGWG